MSKAQNNGDAQELMDEQQKRQLENQAQQAAQAMQEGRQDLADFVDKVTETDVNLIEKCGLENFLSNDFVLAYHEDKDINRIYWLMHVAVEFILAEAPKEGDYITGDEEMELMYGIDPNKTLTEPLSLNDRMALMGVREVVSARITRSKKGFQQEIFKKNVTESHVRRPEQESKGGLRSYLRRD